MCITAKGLALAAAAASFALHSFASEPRRPPSCILAKECGCAIVISGSSCPRGGVHFFHELADGSPLQFDPGDAPATAISTRPQTDFFSPGPGDAWTERYRYGGGSIELHYVPGASTCPKLAQGEQCEYFDVRVRVLLTDPQGTRSYSGIGTCGC